MEARVSKEHTTPEKKLKYFVYQSSMQNTAETLLPRRDNFRRSASQRRSASPLPINLEVIDDTLSAASSRDLNNPLGLLDLLSVSVPKQKNIKRQLIFDLSKSAQKEPTKHYTQSTISEPKDKSLICSATYSSTALGTCTPPSDTQLLGKRSIQHDVRNHETKEAFSANDLIECIGKGMVYWAEIKFNRETVDHLLKNKNSLLKV